MSVQTDITEPEKPKRRRMQFGLFGLFLIITFLCIRLSIQSYQDKPHKTLEVQAPNLASETVEHIRAAVDTVNGVKSFDYENGVLHAEITRPHRSQEVLAIYRKHGVEVTHISVSTNMQMTMAIRRPGKRKLILGDYRTTKPLLSLLRL